MTPEVTLGDKIAQYGLFQDGSVPDGHRQIGGEIVQQVRRNHEISQTKRREQYFAEAACEQHESVAVESLQRGNRAARITVFAVVVILKDERAGPPAPLEQREAPWQTPW